MSLVAGCGEPDAPVIQAPTAGSARSLNDVLGTPGATRVQTPLLLFVGANDLTAGKTVRFPFRIFEKDGSAIHPEGGRAELYFAQSGQSEAIGPFPALELSLRGEGVRFDREGTETVLIAEGVPLPAAGMWFVAATFTVAGKKASAANEFSVLSKEATPAVGSDAPRSDTPTLADVGGDATRISTQRPVDTSLLHDSVKDLLAEKRPFVVVFATPEFCESRVCGPVVDIVLNVQKRMRATEMTFVHLEIYKNLDPEQGASPWVSEWGLPSEPWVFVVDANGKVAAKFESAVTERELESAARAALKP